MFFCSKANFVFFFLLVNLLGQSSLYASNLPGVLVSYTLFLTFFQNSDPLLSLCLLKSGKFSNFPLSPKSIKIELKNPLYSFFVVVEAIDASKFCLSQLFNAILECAVFKLLLFTQNIHKLHHIKMQISQNNKYSIVFGPTILALVCPKL